MTQHPLSFGDTVGPGARRPQPVLRRLVRAIATLALSAIGLLLVPAPAFAWFGWLDRLSGPGPFSGPQFDARLVCIGPLLPRPEARALILAAQEKETQARRSASGVTWNDAADAWLRAASAWQDMAEGALTPGAAADYLAAVKARVNTIKTMEIGNIPAALQLLAADIETLDRALDRTLSTTRGVGVLFSACSDRRVRRASIDLSATFWRADPSVQYANNRQMTLNMIVPSVTWNLIRDARFDVVDAGIGAGVYWFSSPGISTVRGVVVEPLRFDFHAPSSWGKEGLNTPKAWAALPNFRIGLIAFPAGFRPDAFAGTGDAATQLPAELLTTWSIFINLNPILRQWTPR